MGVGGGALWGVGCAIIFTNGNVAFSVPREFSTFESHQ